MDAISAEHSLKVVFGAGVFLILLAIICLKIKNWTSTLLITLYVSIATTVVLATGYLAFSTINLNITSSSGGPVHWHADYEIYYCGQELEMEKPHGISNKIGTSTVHQHGDNRIHLEGVIVERNDVSIGNFFKSVGGQITDNNLIVFTDDGNKSFISGQNCPDGRVAEVQVFVYRVQGKNYSQTKLDNPERYIISPQSQVPPGDCIILEFDVLKDRTDKLCRSFQVAKKTGKLGAELEGL